MYYSDLGLVGGYIPAAGVGVANLAFQSKLHAPASPSQNSGKNQRLRGRHHSASEDFITNIDLSRGQSEVNKYSQHSILPN